MKLPKLIPTPSSIKGYIELTTNLGYLNIELYRDKAPKTCERFQLLNELGHFKNLSFHYCIKNSTIQAETNDNFCSFDNGKKAKYKSFSEDEFHCHVSQQERGVLSLLSLGDNRYKLCILLCPTTQYGKKCSILGRVAGG